MATKTELLTTLSTYDIATLERLVKLAGMIIVPDEDQLVKVTFEQMVEKAHQLADIHFPEWTDRSAADFGEFLVELHALFSEKDFWYINAFANEGFLKEAVLYKSLYAKAIELGYHPTMLTSARMNVDVIFQPGDEVVIPVGQVEISVNGVKFSNLAELVIPASVNQLTRTVVFAEGVIRVDVTRFNGKSVRINQSGVEISSVTQDIDGLTWDRVETFRDSNNTSRHYTVWPDENSVEIEYGNGTYGLRPVVQANITTKFRVCNGASGNFTVTSEMDRRVDQQPTGRSIFSITVLGNPSGGLDSESKEAIRLNAPFTVRTGDRIINVYDVMDTLVQYSDILKAYSYSGLDVFYFEVIPEDRNAVLNLTEIEGRIASKLLVGFRPVGLATSFVVITDLTMTAYFLSGVDTAEGANQIKSIIQNYTSPWGRAEFGQSFSLSELYQELIQNVSGLQQVVFQTVNGSAAAGITMQPHQIMQEIEDSALTINIATV